MSGSDEVLETELLGLERLLCGESAWCHANVLYVPDLITLWELGVVHGTRVPEHEISGVHVDLDQLASSIFKPLDVFLAENEEVHVFDLWWRRIFVVSLLPLMSEKLVEQLRRALHEEKATIIWAIGRKIKKTLYSLHAIMNDQ